jgi:hypothetical protein
MTVSPRRAQDGQHLPSDSDQPRGRVPSELPPTLFKLPNLNPDSHLQAEWDQPLSALPGEPAEVNAAAATGPPEPFATSANLADQAANGEQAAPAVFPSHATPQAPPAGEPGPVSTTAATDSVPGGRTWMERVGSHALILSMLLIVVAAAVLTGRNTGDPSDSDDSVAASVGQEIRFDSQGQVELPIPDHLHLSAPVDVATDHSAAMNYADPFVSAEQRTITQKRALVDRTAAVPSGTAVADQYGTAALSEPQVNRNDSFASAYEYSEAAGISGPGPQIDANQFYDGSTSVGATTVSNRTVMEDEALAVPTLEDLESSAGILPNTRQYDGPNFSRTPFGLSESDLLLHLDELIQRSSIPATSYSAAGSPTPSN